jgi:hypothetical protein
MARKPKTFKKIEKGIDTYYCIGLKNSNYILYDTNMRNPLEWGSIAIVDGLLSTLRDNVTVYYYDHDETFGLRKNNRKKPQQNKDNTNKDYSGRDLPTEWTSLDPLSDCFFYIELENNKVAVFDIQMGQPIIVNSVFKGYDFKSKTNILISKYIPEKSDIYYFKQINGELKFRATRKGK